MSDDERPELKRAIPCLVCVDVLETAGFYVDVLGFSLEWLWGDPPSDAGVRRGGVDLFLSRRPNLVPKFEGSEVVMVVTGIDALYAEHVERGAEVLAQLESITWNRREYCLRGPCGYRLRFTETIEE
ncbi:MAG TPA: glyoxalase superfamily protein [Capsulimonadaceae bacterium]|jgi:catechol 2,3-dioxygenase-like lactoylglutathione lyase family enzyme